MKLAQEADAFYNQNDFKQAVPAYVLFPTVVAVMFAVGLLAAAGPARRGLAVQPTEALRNE